MRSTKPSQRLRRLQRKEYRSASAIANAGMRVAMQIRLLREAAGLTQTELAKKIGTRQSAVARLEDAEYGKQSLAVLHRVAAVFDVVTWVEFIPFSQFLQRTADLSPAAITPKSYGQEFDERGEPRCDVALEFDQSAISMRHYVQPTASGSMYLPGRVKGSS